MGSRCEAGGRQVRRRGCIVGHLVAVGDEKAERKAGVMRRKDVIGREEGGQFGSGMVKRRWV